MRYDGSFLALNKWEPGLLDHDLRISSLQNLRQTNPEVNVEVKRSATTRDATGANAQYVECEGDASEQSIEHAADEFEDLTERSVDLYNEKNSLHESAKFG